MSRYSKRLADIHAEALKEFDEIQEALRDERLQCLADRRFYSIAGAQWEGALSYQFENKPKLEVNKIHLSIMRIINEYRNNRITVDFVSRDGAEDDSLPDTCDMLYRADEQNSCAEEAYDNAFEEGAGGGIGAWRYRNDYEDDEDEDNDHQRIWIEPIYDADTSVFFDLGAKRQDKSDAKRCYVLTSMTREAYENEYGEYPSSIDKSVPEYNFDWDTPDLIFIAEFYRVEEESRKIHYWETMDGEEIKLTDDELEDQLERLTAIGASEVSVRKVKRKRVRKYLMDGARIIEDYGYIAGSNIPIVMVYGKRWYIDNIERCMGHVRLAKDAQRLKNMQLSKLAEISALGSVSKPILFPEQMAGHGVMWSNDNIKNYPYLLIDPVKDQNGNMQYLPPVAYTKTAEVPQALAALLQITEDDISDLLGNQQNGEEINTNVAQGTVELIQSRLDMQTFIYMSNMSKAMRRGGEIWLSMAKDIYVERGRTIRSEGRQGELETVELMQPTYNKEGKLIYENDLSKAKMSVTVEVGPSSSTKRAATVRGLTNMLAATDDPETKQVISAMALMNMEGEGLSDIRDYMRKKLVRMGAVKPTDKEIQEMQAEMANAQPNAQDQYLQAAAQKEQAEALEKQANTILKQAQADESRADTVKTLSEIEQKDKELALSAIEKLGPRVNPEGVS